MQVIRIHTHGGPEVMHLEEVPLPEPGPNQIRVRVMVAGVNFSDASAPGSPGISGDFLPCSWEAQPKTSSPCQRPALHGCARRGVQRSPC
jgi:hypothetical protein